MNNFAVCLQIDLELYEWGLSARSIDLKCMWEPHLYWKTETRDVRILNFISSVLLFLKVNFTEINASVTLLALLFSYHNIF